MNTIIRKVEQKENLELHQFAHELKNPLVVCSGYLEMIPNSTFKQKEKYYKIIQKEVKRSLSIISSFSEKKMNNLNIEEFDLKLLLDEVSEIFRDLFKKNNCKIMVLGKEEIYMHGDYEKLKQVFINLIKNSYEAREDKKLQVLIKIKERRKEIKIYIVDNGIGMTKKELKNATKKYYTTKKYGNGLGIPYSKEMIKLHQGNISIKSKKEMGTKIIVKLPK